MLRYISLSILVVASAACYEVQYDNMPDEMPPPPMMPGVTKTPVIIEFSARDPQVMSGGTTTLVYRVEDAEKVSIEVIGGADVVPQTSTLEDSVITPPITVTTAFLLTATNKDKVETQSVQVALQTVMPPALKHASINMFAGQPASIQAGASAMLSWQTVDAAEGRIVAPDGSAVLIIAANDLNAGTFQVTPAETIVYELVVKGTDNQEVRMTRAINVTPTGQMGMLTARQIFDQNVAGLLRQQCGACHMGTDPANGPDFMGPTAMANYSSITGDARMLTRPENSLLLLKGLHTGPAFTAAEKNTVTAWMLKELDERGTPVMPPPMTGDYRPRTLQEALVRFGACMTRADWDQTYGRGRNTEVAYQNSIGAGGNNGQGGGPCYSCHATGAAGAFLSQSSGDTFEQSRLQPFVLKLVNGTVNNDGSFKDLVPMYRFRDKGNDPAHPSYVLSEARDAAMNEFVDRTLTRFRNFTNACTTP